jgi:hypothetical protein
VTDSLREIGHRLMAIRWPAIYSRRLPRASKPRKYLKIKEADGRIRTGDLLITKGPKKPSDP